MESTKKEKMQFPHPVIFLLLLALLMLILSWIIPAAIIWQSTLTVLFRGGGLRHCYRHAHLR